MEWVLCIAVTLFCVVFLASNTLNIVVWFLKRKIARLKRETAPRFEVNVFRLRDHAKACVYDAFPYAYPERVVTREDMVKAMAAAYFSYCDGRDESDYAVGIVVECPPGRVVLIMPFETPEVALNEMRNIIEQTRPFALIVEVVAGSATINICA
jgi:hypothetical protein